MFNTRQFTLTTTHYALILASIFGVLLFWPGMMTNFFRTQGYEPHGHCYLWDGSLTSLMIMADTAIGLSYLCISLMLAYFVHRTRGKMPFHWVFLAFGLFIVACGATHFTDILTIWVPTYWITGYVRLITMVASVGTALALPWTLPGAFRLIDRANLADQRQKQLELAKIGLEKEVAERKQAEAKLSEVVQQLSRVNDELSAANQDVHRFAYIISHDLRAPLINLKGFSDILRKAAETITVTVEPLLPQLDDDPRKTVENALTDKIPMATRFIDSSVERLDQYTNAILRLSRIGREVMQFQPVDMGVLMQKILDSSESQIAEKHVEVILQPLPEIQSDSFALDQIFANILTNAINYLEPNRPGKIVISAEQQPDTPDVITYRVTDNGRGIAEKDFGKVFEPFRRAGKPDVEGEGMGLSVARALLKRLGGRISFESQLGVGTTFSVILPTQPSASQPSKETEDDPD